MLFILIGNTTVRWKVANRESDLEEGWCGVHGPPHERFRRASRASSGRDCIVACVNPSGLCTHKDSFPAGYRRIGRDISVPIENRTVFPEQVGIDRLLSALGAWRKHGPSIVVDIGTAVTVDLVVEGPAFEGGAILPGPELCAGSLHEKTALLPGVEMLKGPDSFVGRTTEEAISAGIYWGIAGAVRFLAEHMRGGRSDLTLCVTGGGLALFSPLVSTPDPDRRIWNGKAAEEPDLQFLGMKSCVGW